MTVLYVIICGIIQGIFEFLPVSSFGHVTVLKSVFEMEQVGGLLMEAMLHLGTAAAVILCFRKDFLRILEEYAGMIRDISFNLKVLLQGRKGTSNVAYRKIVMGTYRRFAVLILISFVPTALLGASVRRLAALAAVSPMLPGIFFLITGIFLLVTDISHAGGSKMPRDTFYGDAVWMGIAQGISAFPGLSRCGLTICTGALCGLDRRFAIKYSYIMSVPAVIGAFFAEVPGFRHAQMTAGLGFTYFLGMLAAGVTGYFTIRFLMKVLQNTKMRYFAIYCFIIGAFALSGSMI